MLLNPYRVIREQSQMGYPVAHIPHRRSPLRVRLAIVVLMLAVISTRSQERYKLNDLQALDRQQAWDELLVHLKEITPSQRGHEWNQLAKDVCLRPYENSDWWESWKIDECNKTLQAVMNSEPSDTAFALKAGRWSTSVHHWSDAVPFFAHTVQRPGDGACQDPDLIGAVGAGLNLSPGDKQNLPIIEESKRLAFLTCWPATRAEVFRRFSRGDSAFLLNVCEPLKAKENLELQKQMLCERTADSVRHNIHIPATPLDGSSWRIEVVPDQASGASGAQTLRQTAEFTNGWIKTLSKQGFDEAPIQYTGDAGAGTWTARQWASTKQKAEWSGQVRDQNTMEGSVILSKSDGTKWRYSFTGRKEPAEK